MEAREEVTRGRRKQEMQKRDGRCILITDSLDECRDSKRDEKGVSGGISKGFGDAVGRQTKTGTLYFGLNSCGTY